MLVRLELTDLVERFKREEHALATSLRAILQLRDSERNAFEAQLSSARSYVNQLEYELSSRGVPLPTPPQVFVAEPAPSLPPATVSMPPPPAPPRPLITPRAASGFGASGAERLPAHLRTPLALTPASSPPAPTVRRRAPSHAEGASKNWAGANCLSVRSARCTDGRRRQDVRPLSRSDASVRGGARRLAPGVRGDGGG